MVQCVSGKESETIPGNANIAGQGASYAQHHMSKNKICFADC